MVDRAVEEFLACSNDSGGDSTIDETAIKVTDGAVEVVSERHWKLFTP